MKQILMENIDNIHTTQMGVERIKKNLNIYCDAVEYVKSIIMDSRVNIYKKGKNYYCELDNVIITINSYSYTIITAHIKKS